MICQYNQQEQNSGEVSHPHVTIWLPHDLPYQKITR